eukprot:scaffold11415_cov19-Tisochrysis_lutea.AAC.1
MHARTHAHLHRFLSTAQEAACPIVTPCNMGPTVAGGAAYTSANSAAPYGRTIGGGDATAAAGLVTPAPVARAPASGAMYIRRSKLLMIVEPYIRRSKLHLVDLADKDVWILLLFLLAWATDSRAMLWKANDGAAMYICRSKLHLVDLADKGVWIVSLLLLAWAADRRAMCRRCCKLYMVDLAGRAWGVCAVPNGSFKLTEGTLQQMQSLPTPVPQCVLLLLGVSFLQSKNWASAGLCWIDPGLTGTCWCTVSCLWKVLDADS